MKQVLSIALFSLLIISFGSCQKSNTDKTPEITEQTMEVQITSSETYTFNLPEGNFRIEENASYALVSTIKQNETGGIVYEYTPEADFVGIDEIAFTDEAFISVGRPKANNLDVEMAMSQERKLQK